MQLFLKNKNSKFKSQLSEVFFFKKISIFFVLKDTGYKNIVLHYHYNLNLLKFFEKLFLVCTYINIYKISLILLYKFQSLEYVLSCPLQKHLSTFVLYRNYDGGCITVFIFNLIEFYTWSLWNLLHVNYILVKSITVFEMFWK